MSKLTRLLVVGLVVLFIGSAEVGVLHASTMDFNVNPIGEEHEKYGYFKFNVKPNQTISLPIKLDNLSNKSISIDISSLNALTSKYGNIQYIKDDKVGDAVYTDSSYAFKNYTQDTMTIQLKPNETKQVSFKVNLPKDLNKGTLLGGLSFKNTSQSEQETNEEGIKINNELERVVGVQLDYGVKDEGQVKLKDGVSLVEDAEIPYINVGLENDTAEIVERVGVSYKVYTGNKQVFGGETNEFKMAPKSKFVLPIDWGSDTFKSGNYTIQTTVSANGKADEKSAEFEIKEKDVKTFKEVTEGNQRKITVVEEGGTISSSIGYLLIGIVIGLAIFWIGVLVKKRRE